MNIKKITSIIILVIMLSSINFAAQESATVYYDGDLGLYGVKDAAGKVILKATYEYMTEFVDGFAIVENGNLDGAIDESGKLVIPLEYEELSHFKNGHALALRNEKIGLISIDNKVVQDFLWDYVDMIEYPSDYNTFVFVKGDVYGVANFDGEILLDNVVAKLSHISDTSVAFSNDDSVGAMDFDQNIIVKEEFDSVYATKSGYIAEKNYVYQFLDEKGNPLNDTVYSGAELLKDDLYIVSKENEDDEDTYGIFNVSTKTNILPMIYDYISITESYTDDSKEYLSLSIYNDDDYYDTKEGLADLDGNLILEAKYSDFDFLTNDLIAYSDADYNYGLYSLKSKVDTGLKYSDYITNDDSEFLVVETIDGKYGLLNNKLEYAIAPNSAYIYKSGSLYVSEKDNKAALYNPVIEKLGEYKYDDIAGFELLGNLSVSIVKFNGKFGMIKENGSFFISPIYDNLDDFDGGYSIVSKDGLYGFVDDKGKVFIEPKYEMLYPYTNEYAIYQLDGKEGYLNKFGDVAISAKFESATVFDDNGYAAVAIDGKVGVIDTKGQYTIKPSYSDIYKLNDRLIVIEDSETGLFGIADVSGKIIIDTNCNDIGYFDNDEATYIKINSQYALINSKAEIITTFDFDYIGEFYNSFADIEIGDKEGYINTRGEYILE